MANETRKFIAVGTNVRHLDLSWARSSQFSSQTPTSRRSLPILFSQWWFGLPNGFFPYGFPSKLEHNHRFSPILVVVISLHLQHRMSRTVREFLHYTVSSILKSSHPVSARIYFSKPYFQTLVIYVHLLGSYSNFRNPKVLPTE